MSDPWAPGAYRRSSLRSENSSLLVGSALVAASAAAASSDMFRLRASKKRHK